MFTIFYALCLMRMEGFKGIFILLQLAYELPLPGDKLRGDARFERF